MRATKKRLRESWQRLVCRVGFRLRRHRDSTKPPLGRGEEMRVALFFDGKNHVRDLRRAVGERWVDHGRLADWVLHRVGGTTLYAAHYYTGVPGVQEGEPERRSLSELLEDLEHRPGFFVHRFNRRHESRPCPSCGEGVSGHVHTQVHTSLVADLIMMAVQDAYDIAVVFSSDAEVIPGIQAAHALGKRVWVASLLTEGMSRSLSRSAWAVLDMAKEGGALEAVDTQGGEALRAPSTPEAIDEEVCRELRRAQAHFEEGGGFVGAHYFLHRWKGHKIPEAPEARRQALQRLVEENRVETYEVDGKEAVRVTSVWSVPEHEGSQEP